MKKYLTTLAFIMMPFSVTAGQSEWVEVAKDARLRLIFSDVKSADNRTMMAMEIEMPAGTKTYWRVPGETGIPTQFDLSGSNGIGASRIIWPYPEREISYGYVDFVYHQSLVLPVEIEVTDDNPHLELNLILGVCSDICVPVSVDIAHDLSFETRDSSAALRIAQSMSDTPIEWDGPPDTFQFAHYDEETEQLSVKLNQGAFEFDSLIATISDSYIMFGAPQKSPTSNLVTFEQLGGGDMKDMAGQNLVLTFMSADGPYETSLPLALGN